MQIEKKYPITVPSTPRDFKIKDFQTLFNDKRKIRIETIDTFDSDSSGSDNDIDLFTLELNSSGLFNFYQSQCSYEGKRWEYDDGIIPKTTRIDWDLQGTFSIRNIVKKNKFSLLLHAYFEADSPIRRTFFSLQSVDGQDQCSPLLRIRNLLSLIFDSMTTKQRRKMRLVCKLWHQLIGDTFDAVVTVDIPTVRSGLLNPFEVTKKWEIVRANRERKRIPHRRKD